MSDSPPSPPAELPSEVADTLADFSPALLHEVSQYTDALAAFKERADRDADQDDSNGDDIDQPDELPEEVPARATVTVKTINDNRYHYWQWRDGDTVKSKYKGPVNPDE